jgi:hypothetical protein
MAIVTVSKDIDVTDKYQSLIDKLIQDDSSVYIHTIEKLEALISAGDLTSADKAKVISEVLGQLNTSIVNASLQTSLQWAKAEKDAEFQIVELEDKLDLLRKQTETEDANKMKVDAERISISSQSRRMYGVATVDTITGAVTSLSNDGKLYQEIEVLQQQIRNAQAEELVLKGKVRESQASVYKIVADTRANFGNALINLSDESATISLTGTEDSLAFYQKQIAEQQAKGYAYNAWANAVNASSTAVSMLLTAEQASLAGDAASLASSLVSGVNRLLSVPSPQ